MEFIEKVFKKSGWVSILESLIFAVLGIILIWKPNETVNVIYNILGIIFIVVGAVKIINYVFSKGKYDFYNYDLIYGLIAIIIGAVTIAYSDTVSTILRIIIGIWIIYSSLMRANLSFKLKHLELPVWIFSLILAIIMLICGLFVILNSDAVIVTIGIVMVIYAVIDIIETIIFMKNVKDIF